MADIYKDPYGDKILSRHVITTLANDAVKILDFKKYDAYMAVILEHDRAQVEIVKELMQAIKDLTVPDGRIKELKESALANADSSEKSAIKEALERSGRDELNHDTHYDLLPEHRKLDYLRTIAHMPKTKSAPFAMLSQDPEHLINSKLPRDLPSMQTLINGRLEALLSPEVFGQRVVAGFRKEYGSMSCSALLRYINEQYEAGTRTSWPIDSDSSETLFRNIRDARLRSSYQMREMCTTIVKYSKDTRQIVSAAQYDKELCFMALENPNIDGHGISTLYFYNHHKLTLGERARLREALRGRTDLSLQLTELFKQNATDMPTYALSEEETKRDIAELKGVKENIKALREHAIPQGYGMIEEERASYAAARARLDAVDMRYDGLLKQRNKLDTISSRGTWEQQEASKKLKQRIERAEAEREAKGIIDPLIKATGGYHFVAFKLSNY